MNPQTRMQYRAAITPHGETRLQRRPHPLMAAAVVVAVAAVASAGLWVAGVGPSPVFFLGYAVVVIVALGVPAQSRQSNGTGHGLWADVPAPEAATARAVLDVDPGRPVPSWRLGIAYRWRRVPRARVAELHEAVTAESAAIGDRRRAQEREARAAEERLWLSRAGDADERGSQRTDPKVKG